MMFLPEHEGRLSADKTKQNHYFVRASAWRMRSLATTANDFFGDNERNKIKILLRFKYTYVII